MRVGGLVGWRSIFRFSSPRRRCQAYPELPIRDQLAAAPLTGHAVYLLSRSHRRVVSRGAAAPRVGVAQAVG